MRGGEEDCWLQDDGNAPAVGGKKTFIPEESTEKCEFSVGKGIPL